MADAVRAKTKFPAAGEFAVDLVARGDVEMAISQPMEVLSKDGVELVGPLPPAMQDPPNFVFSAGILVSAKERASALALIRFLAGPAGGSAFKAKGMDPPKGV